MLIKKLMYYYNFILNIEKYLSFIEITLGLESSQVRKIKMYLIKINFFFLNKRNKQPRIKITRITGLYEVIIQLL